MAYADILRATTADFADAATLIEGQLITSASYGNIGLGLTTTLSSYAALGVASISLTLPASAKAIIMASASVSLSVNTNYVELGISVDSTTVITSARALYREGNANGSGYNTTLPIFLIHASGTGAHTYRILWKVNSGTAYCNDAQIHGLVLRA